MLVPMSLKLYAPAVSKAPPRQAGPVMSMMLRRLPSRTFPPLAELTQIGAVRQAATESVVDKDP